MFNRLILVLIIPLLVISVTESNSQKNEIIRYTKKVVENYLEGKTRKDIIEYQYEKPDDIYWKKEIQKDDEGSVLRETIREFDENRFPVTEIVTDELGTQTERYKVKYSPDNLQLQEKIEYEGEFKESDKVRYIAYHYKYGYLVSEDVIKYADNDFRNVDGNNIEHTYKLRFILPENSRPRGAHEICFYIEKRKMYYTPEMAERDSVPIAKIGDIILEEFTEFDKDGFPSYYKKVTTAIKDEHAEHRPQEEFFKIEKSPQDGRLLCITGYSDGKYTKNSFETAKLYFSYDAKGWINEIREIRYNDTTKQFNLLHDLNNYKWFTPKINSNYDFSLYTENNEHRCYHGLVHSFNYSEINKYDKGNIVITESSASYDLGKTPQVAKLRKNKKISYKYEIINK